MVSKRYIQAEVLPGGKSKTRYIYDAEELFVEELARRVYKKEGLDSIWSENDYWAVLFALLFWDVIFAKLDGVWEPRLGGDFPGPRQDMPRDFFSEDFFTRRQSLFENRFRELAAADISKLLEQSYHQNILKPCRAINDRSRFSLAELCQATGHLERETLLKILERLAKDFGSNRSGLPDLFVYGDQGCFFAEVKGGNDRLSDKQRAWHSFLSDNLGFKVEIFLVNKSDKEVVETGAFTEMEISFGESTSKKREAALSFIRSQPTFKETGTGGAAVYSAVFTTADIASLYQMLDLTSGWKTQQILVKGKAIKSTNVRTALWCYRQKAAANESLDYCRVNVFDNKKNPLGCRQAYFRELAENRWDKFGYVDTERGLWRFDKPAIQKEIDLIAARLELCPFFDKKIIQALYHGLPDEINPQVDQKWGFLDNDQRVWFYKNNAWRSIWGEGDFPGFPMMIGVKKLDSFDLKDIREAASFAAVAPSAPVVTARPRPLSKRKQKNGCLWALFLCVVCFIFFFWLAS